MKRLKTLSVYETRRFLFNAIKGFVVVTIFAFAFALVSHYTTFFDPQEYNDLPMNLITYFMIVSFFIIPFISYKKTFSYHIQNGFTRSEMFISRQVAFFINSIIFTLVNAITSYLLILTPFAKGFELYTVDHMLVVSLALILIFFAIANFANFYAIIFNKLGLVGVFVMGLLTRLIVSFFNGLFSLLPTRLAIQFSSLPPQGEVSETYVLMIFMIVLIFFNIIAYVTNNKTEVKI